MAAYVVITKNFQISALCLYHFINEFLITMSYFVIYMGVSDEKYQRSSGYAYFCMYFISSVMLLNIVFYAVIKLKGLYMKFVEWRGNKDSKVYPTTAITETNAASVEIRDIAKNDWRVDTFPFGNKRLASKTKNI